MLTLAKTRPALRAVLELAASEAAAELTNKAYHGVHGPEAPPQGQSNKSIDVTDLRTIIHSLVDEYLVDIFQRARKQGSVNSLPVELIASVFSWISTRERPELGLVCRQWHNILHSHPHVWSHIEYDSTYGSPDALKYILGFSAGSPLYLDIRINERSHVASTAAIMAHMHRCVTLRLSLRMDLSTPGAATLITAMLSTGAPQMRYFRMFDASGFFNHGREDKPTALFGNIAPQLEVVKIQCRSSALNESKEAFRQARHVLWSPVEGEGIHRAGLEHIVQMCPELLQLGLDYETWADQEDSAHAPLNLPPNLRSLVITLNTDNSDVRRLMRTLRVELVPQIMVIHSAEAVTDLDDSLLRALYTIPLGSSSGEFEVTPGLFVARTMTIESPDSIDHAIRINMLPIEQDPFQLVSADWTMPYSMFQLAGVQRSIWDIGRNSILVPQCFKHVRRLMIAEALFDPDVFGLPNIPELCELEQLTLYIRLSHDHFESVSSFGSGLISASLSTLPIAEEPNILRCPRLQSVRFATDEVLLHDRALLVEPGAITTFIRRHIRYNLGRLESISLNGIHLYVLSPTELEEMFLLAKETVHDERRITAKFRRPVVMYWN